MNFYLISTVLLLTWCFVKRNEYFSGREDFAKWWTMQVMNISVWMASWPKHFVAGGK